MKKCISYSLFGYEVKQKSGFDFPSFLRGLVVNLRINRLIYPEWVNILHTDKETYTSQYKKLFDWFIDRGLLEVILCPSNEALCKAMLWRMKPVFERVFDKEAGGYRGWTYSHVLCRDLDSICTYREAQAVTIWLREKKSIHCITDSVSHNIPMMGGMIGISTQVFADVLGLQTWEQMMDLSMGIDYTRKGADQDFLNRYIYPKFADSATEHFVLGMVRNLAEGNGRHYSIEDIPLPIDVRFKATNDCAGHIGAAGFYDPITPRFLQNIDPYAKDYLEIEKQFPGLFPWSYEK